MAKGKVPLKPKSAVESTKKISVAGLSQNRSLLGGAVIAVVAGVVWWLLSAPIKYLDSHDDRLKDVFFGRSPHLVLCTNGSSVDTVFQSASRNEKNVVFSVLDCSAKLPSGKSTFERLDLNQDVTLPIMFFTGYGRDPKQLPSVRFIFYRATVHSY